MIPKHYSPTLRQRHGSRALTWIFHHVLRQPSRKAIAGSIREEAAKLSPSQQGRLRDLLLAHKITQRKLDHVPPEDLQHFHQCKIIRRKRIRAFTDAFNQGFGPDIKISYVAGQFSINVTSPPTTIQPPQEIDIEPSLRAKIMGVLGDANRPLTFSNLRKAVKGKKADLRGEIRKLTENGILVKTHYEDKVPARYFLKERMNKLLGRSVFKYENDQGEEEFIYKKDADDLVLRGRACKFMNEDGSYTYMSAKYFNELELETETTEVMAGKVPLRIFNDDIEKLLEQKLLVRGLEEETFASCYIHHEAQIKHRHQIFNAFAHPHLSHKYPDNLKQNYTKLRAAFNAGFKIGKAGSILDFLYEARMVASIGGNLTAVIVALTRNKKALAELRTTKLFKSSELEYIEHCLARLDFVSRFPLLFMPGYAHSLQNFIHFIYDITDRYEVFQLLLVRKLSGLRRLAWAEAGKLELPPNIRREIELVYAPLAESHGFIDLANNMRDLVARLSEPERYQATLKKMEQAIGMERDQARIHIINLARDLKEHMEADPFYNLTISDIPTRVKEIYAIQKKEDAAIENEDIIKNEAIDFLGIRFICKTIDEAYQIAAYLQNKLTPAAKKDIPKGKKVIEDNLARPRPSGWRAWRGYLQEKDAKGNAKGPIMSVQILTEEMLKKDKIGEAAHWSLKAVRAAEKYARKTGKDWKNQNFDPAPLAEYNDDPEHDYYVDQRRARRHVRAFICFKSWYENPKHPLYDLEFSEKDSTFPKYGLIPILRLEKGRSVADAVAFRAFIDSLITKFDHAEVYRFSQDEAGKIKFVPFKRGQKRVPHTSDVPNASLIVVKTSKHFLGGLSESDLHEILSKTQYTRTRLLARLKLELLEKIRLNPNIPTSAYKTEFFNLKRELVKQGKEDPLAKLLNTPDKRRQMEKHTDLRNEDEIFMAIALDLIDQQSIEEALGILKTRLKVETDKKSKLKLSIETPDRPGLLSFILKQLEDYNILEVEGHTNPQVRGASPSHIGLMVKRKSPKQRAQGKGKKPARQPSLGVERLRAGIDKYPMSQLDERSGLKQSATRIKVGLQSQRRNWEILRLVAQIFNKYNSDENRVNVLNIKLPDASQARTDQSGEIIFEITGDPLSIDSSVESIKEEMKKSIRDPRYSIEVIS